MIAGNGAAIAAKRDDLEQRGTGIYGPLPGTYPWFLHQNSHALLDFIISQDTSPEDVDCSPQGGVPLGPSSPYGVGHRLRH